MLLSGPKMESWASSSGSCLCFQSDLHPLQRSLLFRHNRRISKTHFRAGFDEQIKIITSRRSMVPIETRSGASSPSWRLLLFIYSWRASSPRSLQWRFSTFPIVVDFGSGQDFPTRARFSSLFRVIKVRAWSSDEIFWSPPLSGTFGGVCEWAINNRFFMSFPIWRKSIDRLRSHRRALMDP